MTRSSVDPPQIRTALRNVRGRIRFGEVFCVLLLSGTLLVLAGGAIQGNTLTYDEGRHFRYGQQIIGLNSDRFNESEMPVSAFHVLPGFLTNYFRSAVLNASHLYGEVDMIMMGRWVSAAFLLALGLLVFVWSRRLYGTRGGLVSLTLYVFSPTMLAHGTLTTPDMINAAFFVLVFFLYREFVRRPSTASFLRTSVAWGAAQTAKYSSVHLLPLTALIEVIRQVPHILRGTFRPFPYIRRTLLGLLVVLAVIQTAWLFNRSFTPLEDYDFRSRFFSGLEQVFGPVPAPVPYPYLQGLDWVKESEELGSAGGRHGNVYLMGRVRRLGFEGYYLIAHFLKNPLALHFLTLWAVLLHYRRSERYPWLQDEIFIVIPFLYLFIMTNFFFNTQIGIRMLLPAYPFLFVYCGRVGDGTRGRAGNVAAAALIAWYALSALSYHPNYLAYFNEVIGDRRFAYRYLADSNLEWGQSGHVVGEFLRENPDVIHGGEIPAQPAPGRYLIDANNLAGVFDPLRYAWLRRHFAPVRHVGYTHLLFEVGESEAAMLHAEERANAAG